MSGDVCGLLPETRWDTRVVEGQSIIDSYFKETFKPTLQIMLANRAFFSSLTHTKEIWVMGHSLADVGRPYLEEIVRHVDVDRVEGQCL